MMINWKKVGKMCLISFSFKFDLLNLFEKVKLNLQNICSANYMLSSSGLEQKNDNRGNKKNATKQCWYSKYFCRVTWGNLKNVHQSNLQNR